MFLTQLETLKLGFLNTGSPEICGLEHLNWVLRALTGLRELSLSEEPRVRIATDSLLLWGMVWMVGTLKRLRTVRLPCPVLPIDEEPCICSRGVGECLQSLAVSMDVALVRECEWGARSDWRFVRAPVGVRSIASPDELTSLFVADPDD